VCKVFSFLRHGSSWAEKWTSASPCPGPLGVLVQLRVVALQNPHIVSLLQGSHLHLPEEPARYASSRHRMPFNSGNEGTRVDDVAGNEPGR
jgi:hypothetical protein